MKDKYDVRTLASSLGISRQRVYFILKNPVIEIRRKIKMEKDNVVLEKIKEIVKNTPTYGYRKVTAILKGRYEIPIGRKRVYRIMKEHKLLLRYFKMLWT